MKHTYILLITIIVISLSCKAQIVPVEQHLTYLEANDNEEEDEIDFPEGIYFKDVNNLFDAYSGTWIGTIGISTIEVIVTERTDADGYGTTIDQLLLRHRVYNQITEFANTLNLPSSSTKVMKGRYFDHQGNYQLSYIHNLDCGQYGTVYIKVQDNPNEMTFSLYPRSDYKIDPDCVSTEQILPTSYIILTRQ